VRGGARRSRQERTRGVARRGAAFGREGGRSMRAPLVAFACLLAAATCKIRVPAGQGEAAGDFPCERAEECPAPPNACLLSACWEAQCVFVPAPEGTLPPEAQVPGDCKERYCDGNGEIGEGRAM